MLAEKCYSVESYNLSISAGKCVPLKSKRNVRFQTFSVFFFAKKEQIGINWNWSAFFIWFGDDAIQYTRTLRAHLLAMHRECHGHKHYCRRPHAVASIRTYRNAIEIKFSLNQIEVVRNNFEMSYFAGSVNTIRNAFCPSSVLLSIEYNPVKVSVIAFILISSVRKRFKMPGLASACCTFLVPAKW